MSLYPPLGTVRTVVTKGAHGPHNAIDLDAPDDSPLYAPHDGKMHQRVSVTAGNVIEITGDGLFSELFHVKNDEWWGRPDREVRKGERIATMGTTGTVSTGPHLHYAVRVNGVWTFPGSLTFSADVPVPVVPVPDIPAIVFGQLRRDSPLEVELPQGTPWYESGRFVDRTRAKVTWPYFGNPKGGIGLAAVETKTRRVTGRLEWCLVYVRDADVGKPRRA